MTNAEYMWAKLAEECAETIECIQKVLVFGPNEGQDGQSLTNAERVLAELHDVIAVARILHRKGMIGDPEPSSFLVDRKEDKIEKWKARSRSTGALSE